MLVQDHITTAEEFLEAADRELAAGDLLQGSEKLWGAAAHAVMAIAMEREWSGTSHRALKNAVERLATESTDPSIERGFLAAEKFHRNFYHNFLEASEIEPDRRYVRELVTRLTEIRATNQE